MRDSMFLIERIGIVVSKAVVFMSGACLVGLQPLHKPSFFPNTTRYVNRCFRRWEPTFPTGVAVALQKPVHDSRLSTVRPAEGPFLGEMGSQLSKQLCLV